MRCLALVCFLSSAVLFGGVGHDVGSTGAREVFLAFGDVASSAASELVGVGLPFRTIHNTDYIAWRVVRDEASSDGRRHISYEQRLVEGDLEIPLIGGEIALHYSPDARLVSINGSQFTSVHVENKLSIARESLPEVALDRLQGYTNFAATSRGGIRSHVVDGARLLLWSPAADGKNFRRIWTLIVKDDELEPFEMTLDADSGALISLSYSGARDNCAQSSPNDSLAAIGIPIRTGVTQRSLRASTDDFRPSPYFYNGHYQGSGSYDVTIYQSTFDDLYQCGATSYTLFPLSSLTYDNAGVWKGRVAGDAMHNTRQTMSAIYAMGRNGWNGSAGVSRVAIEVTGTNWPDNATFQQSSGSQWPANSVAMGSGVQTYGCAAALDCIAHEWGHGIVHTSSRLPYDYYGVGGQLHEGLADVIGHIVEKKKQPSGYGLEQSSDWIMFEDQVMGAGYFRRADLDDGPGHTILGQTINSAYHKDDSGSTAHDRGNQLAVAFMLLTQGGKNPVCTLQPTLSGCFYGPTTGLGFSKASRIMFDTAVYYMTSTSNWQAVANLAQEAAFDNYSDCGSGNSAETEQGSVREVFRAIGYMPTIPFFTCN